MEAKTYYAICQLNGDGVSGLVRFLQREGEQVQIHVSIAGLKLGKHGFHIHEFGNLTNGCTSAGAHFNPSKQTHGGPKSLVRHAGDLGNIEQLKEQNSVSLLLSDSEIRIHPDISSNGLDFNVIGRSCVVHADEDDLGLGNFEDSKITGHAGARVACGIIGVCAPFDLSKL